VSETCAAPIWDGWHQYPCAKPGKYEVNGKRYCGTHHPERVAKRRAEADARGKAKYDAQVSKARYERACVSAIDAIGGDPATVQELVVFLRFIAADEFLRQHFTIVQQEALAALLAKIPEAS